MPNLTKGPTEAFIEGDALRDLPALPDTAPLVWAKLPKGRLSWFQGWAQDDVYYVWLFQTQPQADRLIAILRGEVDAPLPMFDPVQVRGGRDAITSVFKRKGTPGLIAAIRYLLPTFKGRGPHLYVDMMAVREGWQRRGVNAALIRTVQARHDYPCTLFSEPTADGKAFIAATKLGKVHSIKR